MAEAEQTGVGIGVLRSLGFPLLVTGKGLSNARAATTAVYALGDMVDARKQAGRSPQLRMGRAEGSDILVLADLGVSKRHAALLQHPDGSWWVGSMGQSKTRLGDRVVQQNRQVPIEESVAELRLGEDQTFTFFTKKGFVVLFRGLLAERLGEQAAPTTLELPAEPSAARIPTGVSLSSTGLSILKAVEGSKGAQRFVVALDGALVEEASGWHDLIDLISELADSIVSVEARSNGEKALVYQRGP
jgi:hypothetical protein